MAYTAARAPSRWRLAPIAAWPLLAALGFAMVWIGLTQWGYPTAPYDNLEQLSWLRALEWGYYKHPPLPTWLAWAVVQLVGPSPLVTYALAAAIVFAALGLMATVVRAALGPQHARVALAAALCMGFYSTRLHYYNHNTVLMLWVAASYWLSWRLLHRPRLRDWALLGLVAGLGLLTKYQYALAAAAMAWIFVRQGLWRSAAHRSGLLLALTVALLVVSPHLWWLAQAVHTPLEYARGVALAAPTQGLARVGAVAHWAADVALNRALPALLVLAAIAWATRQAAGGGARPTAQALAASRGHAAAAAAPTADAVPGATRGFLYAWALVPFALMGGAGLVAGAQLQTQWAAGFAWLTVPALLLALRLDETRLATPHVRRAGLLAFVLAQALLLGITWDRSVHGRHPMDTAQWCRFPAAEIAAELRAQALPALGASDYLISGPAAPMQALALHLPGWPRVLIERNLALSPWVQPGELTQTPVLELWPPGQGPHDLPRTAQGWGWRIIGPVASPPWP